MPQFYLGYSDAGEAFDPAVHAVVAEQIASLEFSQKEGDAATLRLEIKNPREGLLSPDRKLWCWFSINIGFDAPRRLFNGRILGGPEGMDRERLRIVAIAKPEDYFDRKIALALSLMAPPFYDPVFAAPVFPNTLDSTTLPDPDAVLEAYSALLHVNPVSLELSISDLLEGEDGTLVFGPGDGLRYRDVQWSYAQKPKKQVNCTAVAQWTQQGTGTVDLTEMVQHAFSDARSSPYGHNTISSLTGEGLFSTWPQPRSNIGNGWTMSEDSAIRELTFAPPKHFTPTWNDFGFIFQESTVQPYIFRVHYQQQQVIPPGTIQTVFFSPYWEVHADFPVWTYTLKKFACTYNASRKRSETLQFTLVADIQDVESSLPTDIEQVSFNSQDVASAIDFNDQIPIGDARRASYFQTARGQQSVEYFILFMRAKLRAAARCIRVEFSLPLMNGLELSLRKNATIFDPRLPGGQATGKITDYALTLDNQGQRWKVSMACAVGHGGTVALAAGTPVYVEDGYFADPVQVMTGQQLSPAPGEVAYEEFSDFAVEDDGINLLALDPAQIASVTLFNGLGAQAVAAQLEAGHLFGGADPIGVIKGLPTRVEVQLAAMTGNFNTTISPAVTALKIPKGIDLEARAAA